MFRESRLFLLYGFLVVCVERKETHNVSLTFFV
jgi:hypothetical protein